MLKMNGNKDDTVRMKKTLWWLGQIERFMLRYVIYYCKRGI